MRRHQIAAAAACLAAVFQAGPSGACFFHALGNESLTPAHPGALSVAVALNKAQRAGVIAPLPAEADARYTALEAMRADVFARSTAQAFRRSGPPVSILLTQSGIWIRLNDPVFGAVFHAEAPPPGESTLILPDTALQALINGDLTLQEARAQGLLRVIAAQEEPAIAAFRLLLDAPSAVTEEPF